MFSFIEVISERFFISLSTELNSIMKFLHNACPHWFKERDLWEYKALNEQNLTPSPEEMENFRIFSDELFQS